MHLLNTWLRVLAAVVVAFICVPVSAVDGSGSIGQGYRSDQKLSVGTIVSFGDESGSGKVVAANTDTADKLVGVVTDSSLVELSSGVSDYTVATSGTTYVLVSNLNGDVKKGDPITASPVAGIGMVALENAQIIGTAEASFSEAEQVSQRTVKLRDGTSRSVSIGLIPAQINVTYFNKIDKNLSFLPSFLQTIANNIAGRSVSPLRVLVALCILVAGLGAAAVMLSASVRSSIISIGRNPLSARAVHRSLFEVGGIGLGILFVMLIAVYLVLIL